MRRREWRWRPHGWSILLILGRSWGLGFFVMGRNGTDIYIGPMVLSIMPPVPASWRFMTQDEIAADKSKIDRDT